MQQFTDQRLLLHEIPNHAEFKEKLKKLGLTSDLPTFDASVIEVVKSWVRLARQHAEELGKLDPDGLPRAVYSRAYYTAYSASKAVRYMSRGAVSLKGDDHRKVSDLPDSFPDVDVWARQLQELYEHRLRADYDNWVETAHEHSLKPIECKALAEKFVTECLLFLKEKYQVEP